MGIHLVVRNILVVQVSGFGKIILFTVPPVVLEDRSSFNFLLLRDIKKLMFCIICGFASAVLF